MGIERGIYPASRQVFVPHLRILSSQLFQHPEQTRKYATKSTTHYYDVLGISSKATHSQIKSAYFSLSKVYHPDLNPSKEAKAKFEAITEAYNVLSNVHKRRQYDRFAYKPSIRPDAYNRMASEFKYPPELYKRPFVSQSMGRTQYYDFDEFYRQHYTESLKRDERHKSQREFFYKAAEERRKNDMDILLRLIGMTCVVFFAVVVFAISL